MLDRRFWPQLPDASCGSCGTKRGFSNSSMWPLLHWMTPYARFKRAWAEDRWFIILIFELAASSWTNLMSSHHCRPVSKPLQVSTRMLLIWLIRMFTFYSFWNRVCTYLILLYEYISNKHWEPRGHSLILLWPCSSLAGSRFPFLHAKKQGERERERYIMVSACCCSYILHENKELECFSLFMRFVHQCSMMSLDAALLTHLTNLLQTLNIHFRIYCSLMSFDR